MHANLFDALARVCTPAELLNHLWQSSVVALALVGLLLLGRNLPARTRRLIGWAALAKFAVPVAAIARLFASATAESPANWIAPTPLPFVVFTGPQLAGAANEQGSSHALLVCWLVGFTLCFGAWLARGFLVRRRILRVSQPTTPGIEATIVAVAARCGLRRAPRHVAVDPDLGPAVMGILRPILLVPRGLDRSLTPREFEAVLMHELVHIRQRDNLWAALQALVVSVLWFNPVAWLLSRCIAIATEMACDERVVALTGDAELYATVIVKTARHSLGLPQPTLVGIGSPPVLQRLRHVLSSTTRPRVAPRIAAVACTVALLSLSGYAGTIATTAEVAVPKAAVAADLDTAPAPAPALNAATGAQAVPDTSDFIKPAGADANTDIHDTKPLTLAASAAPEPAVEVPFTSSPSSLPTSTPTAQLVKQSTAGRPTALTLAATESVSAAPTAPIAVASSVASTAETSEATPSPAQPDRAPVVRVRVPPVYPGSMRDAGVNGRVTIAFVVTAQGDVADAHIIDATHPEFEPAALDAITQWKFDPGIKGGRAVNTRMEIPIIFTAPPRPVATAAASLQPEAYDIAQLDHPPVAVFRKSPFYPFALRRAGITGEVTVDFVVNDRGEVVNPRAIRSSNPGFESAAVQAVSHWKFRPGQKGGRPVNTHMQVPIVFDLRDE
jgi:TonB family protein